MKTYLIIFIAMFTSCTQREDFKTFPKIDAHIHLETADDSFIKVIRENNLKMISLAYDASSLNNIQRQLNYSEALQKKYPRQIAFATTFSMEDFGEPDWQEKTIQWLHDCFQKGAVAVKVWKDIGMTFRDKDSSFILMDDKRFDPVWDYIESEGITVVNHTAEPKNCWLPLDQMTTLDDSSYYANNPQYHMYLHPGYPSYEDLLVARNRMLDKHPGLRYVACHLASLEWSVDEQAKFLDKYPNAALDMASRVTHFKYQNRDDVRNFLIKYQDRLLYGTDIEILDTERSESTEEELKELISTTYLNDWEYFTTDKTFTQNDKVKEYQGLNLSEKVLKKIYYTNALGMYPKFADILNYKK